VRLLTLTKTATVNCLASSPDGTRLAAGGHRANVRVWGVASGRPQFNLKGTKDHTFVGFAADPDRLVVSKHNTPPVLWDLPAQTSRPLGPAPPAYCFDTAVSPDGTRVARAEGRVLCRDAADGRTVWQTDWVERSDIHPLVRFAAVGSRLVVIDKHVTVRDAATGEEVGGFDLTFRKYASVNAAAVSPDGRWLALRGPDGVQVHDTAGGRRVFEEPALAYGYALAFTPDGARLAAGSYGRDGGVHFWDVGSWRRGSSLDPGIGGVKSLAFSADGLLGAAGGFRGGIAVWDLD
jgi:WD40 repeat protein